MLIFKHSLRLFFFLVENLSQKKLLDLGCCGGGWAGRGDAGPVNITGISRVWGIRGPELHRGGGTWKSWLRRAQDWIWLPCLLFHCWSSMPSKRELGRRGILKMLNQNIPTGVTTRGGRTSGARSSVWILSVPVTWNNVAPSGLGFCGHLSSVEEKGLNSSPGVWGQNLRHSKGLDLLSQFLTLWFQLPPERPLWGGMVLSSCWNLLLGTEFPSSQLPGVCWSKPRPAFPTWKLLSLWLPSTPEAAPSLCSPNCSLVACSEFMELVPGAEEPWSTGFAVCSLKSSWGATAPPAERGCSSWTNNEPGRISFSDFSQLRSSREEPENIRIILIMERVNPLEAFFFWRQDAIFFSSSPVCNCAF